MVCPFLNDSPDYARGVEFGMLYEKMQRANEIKDLVTTANQEQVCLLANRTGWTIQGMQKATKGWIQIEMTRNVPLPESP